MDWGGVGHALGSIKRVQVAQMVLERERSGTGEGLVGLRGGWWDWGGVGQLN